MEKSLLTPAERKTHEIRFNVDGLLRGDYETRMKGFALARQNGWMSANEIRSYDRQYPIAEELGGDRYMVNGNMVDMGRRRDAGDRIDGEIDVLALATLRADLAAGADDITVWINSPGGDVHSAAQMYTALREYPGKVTVQIDSQTASAASVIAMAGDRVLMSPVSYIVIHNPATIAIGDSAEMQRTGAMLDEIKEGIINA